MSSTFHHPPPPPQTRNHISDLGNNCFATPTNAAKKQRLLRAQKALQTALISQISQLGNEGQVQLEVMGKYPWEKKEFEVRSGFHNMLFVAVLMFETHGCCLPWWDSPILVFTSARRSLTLLVWSSQWCRDAWGRWRLGAGLRAGGSVAQGTPQLQLPSRSRGAQHTNTSKAVLLQNRLWSCLCVHGGLVQPCCWHPVPPWCRGTQNTVVPVLVPPKSLHLRSLHCRARRHQEQGVQLKGRHCVGPETSWASLRSFCCHFPLNGCYFLILLLAP